MYLSWRNWWWKRDILSLSKWVVPSVLTPVIPLLYPLLCCCVNADVMNIQPASCMVMIPFNAFVVSIFCLFSTFGSVFSFFFLDFFLIVSLVGS